MVADGLSGERLDQKECEWHCGCGAGTRYQVSIAQSRRIGDIGAAFDLAIDSRVANILFSLEQSGGVENGGGGADRAIQAIRLCEGAKGFEDLAICGEGLHTTHSAGAGDEIESGSEGIGRAFGGEGRIGMKIDSMGTMDQRIVCYGASGHLDIGPAEQVDDGNGFGFFAAICQKEEGIHD